MAVLKKNRVYQHCMCVRVSSKTTFDKYCKESSFYIIAIKCFIKTLIGWNVLVKAPSRVHTYAKAPQSPLI